MPDTTPRLTSAQCRDAGFALTLILLLVAHVGERLDFVVPAIVVMVLAMMAPKAFWPWAFVWWKLASALSEVGSRILLTLVFGLIVTPVALFRRMIGADPMRGREWKDSGTVLVNREGAVTASDVEQPY